MVLAWARKQLGLGEAEAQKALDEKDEAPTKAGGKANGKVRQPDGKAKASHGAKGSKGARERAPRPHANGRRPASGAPAPAVPNVVPEGGRRPKTPEEDPAFRAVKARIGAAGEATKDHPPPQSKAAEAQAAAKGPPNEVQSQAKGAQVDDMAGQKPGAFDKKAFMAAVHKAVEAATPKNLKQVSDFAESGKAGEVGDRVAGMVTQNKEAAERGIKDTTAAQPDPSRGEAKEVVPMQEEKPGAPPAPVAAASGMPPPATAQETDLSKGPADVDKELKENDVTEEQLQESNEPDMQQAVDAKKDAEKHSTEAPKAYRAEEAAILGKAKTESEQEAAAGLGGMHKSKVSALTQIAGSKTRTKSADEAKRAKVASDLEAIYGKTKTDVTKILDGIEPKVTAAFDTGEQAARQGFESYVDAQMTAYKDDRYSGWRGKLRWFRDKLLGMPDAVNRFYETGKSRYIVAMDGVISNVADIVGNDLNAAHARIAQGQAEVKKYVTGLPKDLKKLGNEAAAEMGRRFQQLESDVDAKQEDLVSTIANKYVESSGNLDKRIEELKEANKGLVDKAIGFVKGAIETIRKLKDLLMNVLRKAISVIGDILRHPIRFIENFMSGVKDGLHLFTDKIGSYLEDALIGWLFGPSVLGGRAIEKPQSLDFKGVVSLVLQVLGLTKEALLDRLTKKVGAPAVDKLKKGVEWIGLLITEGPGGLWKWVQQKVGDLYETVIGGIKDWVITKVIKAGITWLISLLNPAGALVKIVKAIVDVVTFIFERAEQIIDFINAVLDAVIDVAKGNLGGVAKKIADGLGKGLSLAIGFLASLLGLGGIGETVRGIIDKVRAPIKNLVDGLIDGAVRMAKRLFGRPATWAKAKYAQGKAAVKAGVQVVKEKGKKALKAVGRALGIIKADEIFDMEGEGHTLAATGTEAGLSITMASGIAKSLLPLIQAARAAVKKSKRPEAEKRTIDEALEKADVQAAAAAREWATEAEKIGRRYPGDDPDVVKKRAGKRAAAKSEIEGALAKSLRKIITALKRVPAKGLAELLEFAKTKRFLPPEMFLPGRFRRLLYDRPAKWTSRRDEFYYAHEPELYKQVLDLHAKGMRLRKPSNVDPEPEHFGPKLSPREEQQARAELRRLMSPDVGRLDDAEAEGHSIRGGAMIAWERGLLMTYYEETKYDVDHKVPLAQHWKEAGHKTDDEERAEHATAEHNLRLMTRHHNRAKGARVGIPGRPGEVEGETESHHFQDIPYVDEDFESACADEETIGDDSRRDKFIKIG